MAGKTNLGTYSYEVTIDGKKAVLEIQNLEQKTEKAVKKVKSFGDGIKENFQAWIKSGLGFNSLLGSAVGIMMQLKNAIAGGIKSAIDNNETAKKSFESLGTGITNLFTKIGEFLLPVIKSAADITTKLLNAIGIATGNKSFNEASGRFTDLQRRRDIGEISQIEYEENLINKKYYDRANIIKRLSEAYQELEANRSVGNDKAAHENEREIMELRSIVVEINNAKIAVLERAKAEEALMQAEYKRRDIEISARFTEGAARAQREIDSQYSPHYNVLDQGDTGKKVPRLGVSGGKAGSDMAGELAAIAEAIHIVSQALQDLDTAVKDATQTYAETGDVGKSVLQALDEVSKKIPVLGDVVSGLEAAYNIIDNIINAEKKRQEFQAAELARQQANYYSEAANQRELLFQLGRQKAEKGDTSMLQGLITQRLADLQAYINNGQVTYNEQLSAEIEINNLYKERDDLNKGITSELANQTDNLQKQKNLVMGMLSDLTKSGLIDVENILAQSKINAALTNSGIIGIDRMKTLTDLGVTGQNIGQVNIEVNEAQGNTTEKALQSRLLNMFSGGR